MAVDTEQRSDELLKLTQAFELFSRETARLEKSYLALKEEFKKVNLELEDTNAFLNSILSNMRQGLVFISPDGCITTYNAAAEELLKVPKRTVIGRPYADSFADDYLGFSLSQALSVGKAPPNLERTLVRQDGSQIEARVDVSFVSDTAGDAEGMIILLVDVTEVRRLQKLAVRNDRLKELGEMAASVAHEIRNPLGGIEGFASLLYRDLAENPKSQDMAAYIVEGTRRLNRLVSSVLHYARPLELQVEVADLIAVINDTLAAVEVDSKLSKNLIIERKYCQNQLELPLDTDMFRGALLNLVVNAAQAMPQGGRLTVSVENTNKQEVKISVRDTGEGISPENIEKIFSPFFTTKQDGNGFGLSEVHRCIQLHGGHIDVESSAQTGTTFTIVLPSS